MTLKDARFTPPKRESGGSNMPLLLIASAFLCVTIVLALLQPGLNRTNTSQPSAAAALPTAVATPGQLTETTPVVASEPTPQIVTRTQTPLLSQVKPPSDTHYKTMSAMITDKLRQPLRLSQDADTARDLPDLARQVLAGFITNADTPLSPDLVTLLVDSVGQKQSDAYVHVLLNTAVARGRFDVPQALRTASGGIDTNALLIALAQNAGGRPSVDLLPVTLSGTHTVAPDDSLAGIAMRRTGQPMMYLQIMQKNAELSPRNPQLAVGQVLQIDTN